MEPSARLLVERRAAESTAQVANFTKAVEEFFKTPLPEDQVGERAGYYMTPLEIIFLFFATLFWLTRLYGRYVSKSFGPDDVLVTLALICTYLLSILHNIAFVHWGLGKHYLDHSINYEMLGLLEWIDSLVFVLSALFAKMSILCFYLRFADALSGRFRYAVYATMAFVTLWTVSIAGLLLGVCRPLQAWWDIETMMKQGRSCLSARRVGIVLFLLGALNMLSDVIVFLLPAKVLWNTLKSHLERWQRVRVMVMPTLGLLACVAGAVRIKPLMDLLSKADPSWYEYPIYTLVAIEIDLIIICACLPFSKPAVNAFLTFIGKRQPQCSCSSPSCSRSHSTSPEEDTRRRPSAAHIYGAVDCMIYCQDRCHDHTTDRDGTAPEGPETNGISEDMERGREPRMNKMSRKKSALGAMEESRSREESEAAVKFNDVVFS